jgi:hypothetical protein
LSLLPRAQHHAAQHHNKNAARIGGINFAKRRLAESIKGFWISREHKRADVLLASLHNHSPQEISMCHCYQS